MKHYYCVEHVSSIVECPFLLPSDTVKHSNLSITHSFFLEFSFSKSGGVHDKLHISSADLWELLLPLA